MDISENKNKKKMCNAKTILTTGIPLEMAVYDFLASGIDADWIDPGYEFAALNETGNVIQRSLDFVASVPTLRNPLEMGIRLYFLMECKYCNSKELKWIFMPDVFPKFEKIFLDNWHPALWQEIMPEASVSTPEVPLCVRGTILGVDEFNENEKRGKNQSKLPMLTTALNQLRDCVHHLANERFRLFTKQWSQPKAIVFVPIIVTNAELRVLKTGIHKQLLANNTERIELEQITTVFPRLLVRCPSSLEQVDWKWQKFDMAHSKSNLSRIEKGLPMYKRERTIEFHLREFFSSTPAYIMVANLENVPQLLAEIIKWAKGLEFK